MDKKILIIDDEKDFCYFAKKNLEAISNYEIIATTKGKKGIQIARKEKPDLILLDIMMPGIDGFEVLKRLREMRKQKIFPLLCSLQKMKMNPK